MHDARTEAKRWLEAAREDLAYARHAARRAIDLAERCVHESAQIAGF